MSTKRKSSSTYPYDIQAPPAKKIKILPDEYSDGLPDDCVNLILHAIDYPSLFRMFFVSKRIYQLSLAIFNYRIQTSYPISPSQINHEHVKTIKSVLSHQSFLYSLWKIQLPGLSGLELLVELRNMQRVALTTLQQDHIRSLEISPLLRPILDKIVVKGPVTPYSVVEKTVELNFEEAECNFFIFNQPSKYCEIESRYCCEWSSPFAFAQSTSSSTTATAFLHDFDAIEGEDVPSCSFFKLGAAQMKIRTAFEGTQEFKFCKKTVLSIAEWLGIPEISLEGELESLQLFCNLLVQLIKPFTKPTMGETIELLKAERISRESVSVDEIWPRLQELFLNDDRESWLTMDAMLSVIIPKMDLLEELADLQRVKFFDCADPDLCTAELTKLITDSIILYWKKFQVGVLPTQTNFHCGIVLRSIKGTGSEVKLQIVKSTHSPEEVGWRIQYEAKDQSYQNFFLVGFKTNTELVDRLANTLGLSFPSSLVDLVAWIAKAPTPTYDHKERPEKHILRMLRADGRIYSPRESDEEE